MIGNGSAKAWDADNTASSKAARTLRKDMNKSGLLFSVDVVKSDRAASARSQGLIVLARFEPNSTRNVPNTCITMAMRALGQDCVIPTLLSTRM